MEFTVSGTTVRFDERTMQFAFTRDGAEWNTCADFKPTLQCAQGTLRSRMPLPSPMSSVKPAREPAFAASSPALGTAHTPLKPMYGWSVPQAMCSSNGFRSMSKA